MLVNTFQALAGCLTTAHLCRILDRPARTVRRWRQTGHAPTWALSCLETLQTGAPLTDPHWHGWRVQAGILVSPEGDTFTPARVRSLHYLEALNRELQRKLAGPQQWRLI